MISIVSGVSGTGKTTIGLLLAAALGLRFYDADDFHPLANTEKMANGIALNDEDRQPWLEALADKFSNWEGEGGAVLACSALKESYRQALISRSSQNIGWIVLTAPEGVLQERLDSRTGHFMSSRLLLSQLNDFEMPEYGLILDVRASPQDIAEIILAKHKQGWVESVSG